MPVEYSTISIVRSVSVRAASINRATSSTVRMVGRRRGHLRIRDVVEQVPSLQRLHEEEPERRDMELHRPRLEFAVAQQVRLIRRGGGRLIELVRRAVEMLREPLDGLDVGTERWSWRSCAAGVRPASLVGDGSQEPPCDPHATRTGWSSVPHA